MKRFFCILLALGLLLGCALAEDDWDWNDDDWDEFGETWELLESRFGYSLWYNADQLTCWTEEYDGQPAEMLCPWEDESGVAVMICRGSRFSVALFEDYTPVEPEDVYVYLEYPYEMTAYTDGEVIVEQWIVSAADADYVFIIQYETDDRQNWAILFHDTLSGLEFPNQSAENTSFRLDYFDGGAAGTQFFDVVVDVDAEPMVLMPLENVTNFSLDLLDWDTSGDYEDWSYTVITVCTARALAPGQNLRIYSYIPDMMPNLRISYCDAAGEQQRWLISESGMDGSLMLIPEDEL